MVLSVAIEGKLVRIIKEMYPKILQQNDECKVKERFYGR